MSADWLLIRAIVAVVLGFVGFVGVIAWELTAPARLRRRLRRQVGAGLRAMQRAAGSDLAGPLRQCAATLTNAAAIIAEGRDQ